MEERSAAEFSFAADASAGLRSVDFAPGGVGARGGVPGGTSLEPLDGDNGDPGGVSLNDPTPPAFWGERGGVAAKLAPECDNSACVEDGDSGETPALATAPVLELGTGPCNGRPALASSSKLRTC